MLTEIEVIENIRFKDRVLMNLEDLIMSDIVMITRTGRTYALGYNLVLRYLEAGDGILFGEYNDQIMDKPFLMIACTEHEVLTARVCSMHSAPAYKAVFRDMKHVGFSDMKHAIPKAMSAVAGKLDADLMHENLCRCHKEFFDTHLKKVKSSPELKTNDVMRYAVYE